MHYILDDEMNPVAATMEEYIEWNNSPKRVKSIGKAYTGDIFISTVFLGLDHNFSDEGEPILFETMVFPDGDFIDERCERYCTFAEAVDGHKQMCKEYGAVEHFMTDAVYEWLNES